MTIHASKGLEFPIVAVAECWGRRQVSCRRPHHRGHRRG
ncbi:MAG: hypothetical protein LKF13_06630 [Atopobiaceae bacterium]|nr:hypothetical protein [Atopobiaceae bacterium]